MFTLDYQRSQAQPTSIMKKIKQIYYKLKFRKMITKNLEVGTKLIVVGTTSGHSTPIGAKVTLRCYSTGVGSYCGRPIVYINENINGGQVQFLFLEDLRLDHYTVEDIKNELVEAEKVVADAVNNVENIKLKLDYLKEVGESNFDENEFRAYNTLKTLDNTKLSTLEKAKQIASLFNK